MIDKKIAAKRGYMAIGIRQRGPIGRGMRKAVNAASKVAWHKTAEYFHLYLRDERFTEEHARAAGYTLRKGEGQPRGSKAFARSYTGRKLRSQGHTRPLEFTGDTRRAMNLGFNIKSTSKGGRVAYRSASKFSFRHPKSQIRMSEEFRRLLPSEVAELGRIYDDELDKGLAKETKE